MVPPLIDGLVKTLTQVFHICTRVTFLTFLKTYVLSVQPPSLAGDIETSAWDLRGKLRIRPPVKLI